MLRTSRIVLVSLPSQQQFNSRLNSRLQLEPSVNHICLTRSTITTSAFMDVLGFRLVAGQDTVDLPPVVRRNLSSSIKPRPSRILQRENRDG